MRRARYSRKLIVAAGDVKRPVALDRLLGPLLPAERGRADLAMIGGVVALDVADQREALLLRKLRHCSLSRNSAKLQIRPAEIFQLFERSEQRPRAPPSPLPRQPARPRSSPSRRRVPSASARPLRSAPAAPAAAHGRTPRPARSPASPTRSVRMRPPTRFCASSTSTRCPASASARAAVNPAMPAPITRTSASLSKEVCGCWIARLRHWSSFELIPSGVRANL